MIRLLIAASVLSGVCFMYLALGSPRQVIPTVAATGCESPDPLAAVPGAPHGLFVANANIGSTVQTGIVDRYLPTDATVCGADLVVPWSAVDLGPNHYPRYDWHFVDNAAAPWIAAGKIVNLIIWGVAEDTRQEFGGPVTPAYVLRAVDTITCPGPYRPASPAYWEAAYQTNYRAFMRAVVKRYGHDPHVSYFRFGIGAGDEDSPAEDVQGPCLQRWEHHGLNAARWLHFTRDMIRYEASLHSPKQLLVSLNTLDAGPTLAVPRAVAAQAAASGIGFGFQSLDQFAFLQYRRHATCFADWCALFSRFAGRVPLEVQTLRPSDPTGSGPVSALPRLLTFALQERAQIVELYPQEWLTADDPGFPNYSRYYSMYRTALESAASVTGASIRVLRNVPYVPDIPAGSLARRGDVYLPAPYGVPRPGVVVIHGGGWFGGSKSNADAVYLATRLAEHGYVAFDINYRLSGDGGQFPNDVQDVKDALAFLGAHASAWHIDTHRIAAVGTSSGGHLALMAGYTPNAGLFAPPHYPHSKIRVAAVGDFFGPADLSDFPGPTSFGATAVYRYLGVPYGRDPSLSRKASPVSYVNRAVPTFIEHGTADGLVPYSQSVRLDALLRARGVRQELVSVPGGQHGLRLAEPGAARDMEAGQLEHFLDGIFGMVR